MAVYKPGRPHKYNPTTEKGSLPPMREGEYRIRDRNGNITYIGETNNLRRRMNEHIRSGKLPKGAGENSTFEYKLADRRSFAFSMNASSKYTSVRDTPVARTMFSSGLMFMASSYAQTTSGLETVTRL